MPNSSDQISRTLTHRGITVPTFLYGTAWKEDRTEVLTKQALESGFLGIDTANQRRHYFEAGVGSAVKQILSDGNLKRENLFLQTKFTYVEGQDHRLPYEPKANHATQVQQSFKSSLEHLGTTYVDSYVLHGPSSSQGLTKTDWEVWQAMEELQCSGAAKLIGVSNIGFEQLRLLLERAVVKPAFVQNRCYARTGWDVRTRELCRSNDILYQGFSLLTANVTELNRPEIQAIAKRLKCAVTQVVFRFALQVGMIPLTGTTSKEHMTWDLASYELGELSAAEINTIENISRA